jgi:hypothetical protein
VEVLFRKRDKRGGVAYAQQAGAAPADPRHSGGGRNPAGPQLYRIDYDMMLKGSICKRRKGPVRQYGVTVNGTTRLVTSGDTVDEETYDALLRVGALRPVSPPAAPAGQGFEGPPPRCALPLVVDHTASDAVKE